MLQRIDGKAKKKSLFFFLAAAALLFLLLFLGAGVRESLLGTALADDPNGEFEILELRASAGSVWMACRGEDRSLLMKLDSTGRILQTRELSSTPSWAALRGGALFLREDGARSVLVTCDPDTLRETSRRELPWAAEKLLFFDCDSGGTAYGVTSDNRKILRTYDGTEKTTAFPGAVEFLSADGELCLAASGSLYLGSSPASLRAIPCLAAPLKYLEAGRLMDADGTVRAVEENSLRSLFRCDVPLFGSFSFCSDGEKGLIVSAGGGAVHRYGPAGTLLGTCQLGAVPLALCRAGAVFRKGGKLRFAPFAFARATPSPSPSPTPKPTADPLSGAPAALEGEMLLVSPGFTAGELRELMKPEAIHIRDKTGQEVLSGRLATGMTAGSWTVVVLGDCDGSGTVTRKDLQAAVELTAEDAGTAAFRAADLNADGSVDGADLLLFSEALED